VLAAGTLAQSSFSVVGIGLPVLAPALRDEFGLSLTEVGVVLSGTWIGATFTLLPWGLLADRLGERAVLASGLAVGGLGLAAAGFAPDFASLVILLALAGAAGSSVNAASGRAVIAWFPRSQRGLALGIRQTAIPIGGGFAAVVLPPVEHAGGIEAAFVVLGCFCLVAAAVGALTIRDRPEPGVGEAVPWTLRDPSLWRLCGASGLYVVGQVAVISFVVLFLHDERGWSVGEAAAVLGLIQLLAVGTRIGAGAWSDRVGARVPPLRRIGLASCLTLALVAVLLDAPAAGLVCAFLAAGAISMAWNGLSFTAAAELAGRGRSGAAIGLQQTALSVIGLGVPVAFAATVSASSWRLAYALAALCPLAGAIVLRDLEV
jgi:sugar phosphate permease